MNFFKFLLTSCLVSPMLATAAIEPATAPKESEYPHHAVKMTQGGKDDTAFWLYEPADPVPGEKPPLVIFLHGWAATDPWVYSAWIDHLTRQGNVVIYPRYQQSVLTMPMMFLGNAVKGIKDALAMTETEGHVKPDLSRCVVVGHSAGGLITAGFAGMAGKAGFPVPKAICCVQPGKTQLNGKGFGIPLENVSSISAETLLLVVTGDKDAVCGDSDAKKILAGTTQIASANKFHLIQTSNSETAPGLRATHYAPCSTLLEVLSTDPASETANEFAALAGVASGDMGPLRAFLRTTRGRKWLQETKNLPDFTLSLAPPDTLDFALWKAFDELKAAAFAGKKLEQDGNLGTWVGE